MRIICWFTSFWNNLDEAIRYEKHPYYSFKAWSERADYLFHPIAKVVACGTWSDPDLCPAKDLIVVNSGAPYVGQNSGLRNHYSRCALTGLAAWALNRNDWDLLIHWDHDSFLGDIDFDNLIREFMSRPECWLSPRYWVNEPGGPLIIWKREAAQRWLHYRRMPNIVDPNAPNIPNSIEQEYELLYTGRWWNPFPTKLNYLDMRNESDSEVESWPMVVWLRERSWERYYKEKCPKAKPYRHEDNLLAH